MKFSDYHISPDIKSNLDGLKYIRPTDIQFKTIGPILNGEDVLAIAQTGTGKTGAFVIPILNKINQSKSSKRSEGIKCLVMVPTRELALQITEVFLKIGKNLKVKTACVYGGVEQDNQIKSLEKGIDVLVTTPGRMFDLINQKYISLDKVEVLVLDEADHMLDLGFIKDIQDVIKFLPKNRQTLFFSATINKNIKKLAYTLIRGNAIRIQISPQNLVSKNIEHSFIKIKMDDKRYFLEKICRENPDSKVLVFVRTKVRAERVKEAMKRVGIEAESIHGNKEQKDRISVLETFKKGFIKVLITTDVSARGIDIPLVEYVVNYDLPEVGENYVHRIGRTGRGNQKGTAISFCAKEEEEILEMIEEVLGRKIQEIKFTKNEYNEIKEFKEEVDGDWKSIIQEIEAFDNFKKKKKRK